MIVIILYTNKCYSKQLSACHAVILKYISVNKFHQKVYDCGININKVRKIQQNKIFEIHPALYFVKFKHLETRIKFSEKLL